MGHNNDGFVELIRSLIEPHYPELSDGDFVSKLSRGNRYQAVTVTIQAQSQDQLDNIYRSLSGHADILVVL